MRLTTFRTLLAERAFRMLFTSSAVDALGDGVARVALAFAVLDVTHSPAGLGAVLAARQVTNAVVVLAGGVLSDRVRRERVLVAAAVVQGSMQAACALLLGTGRATVLSLAALQAAYGAAQGFVVPATVGIVPKTVRAELLQQANALVHLAENAMGIAGPALAGVLLAAGSPAWALAVDAASFAVAAVLLAGMRLGAIEARPRAGFLHELREGWSEFVAQRWLWTTVVTFGIYNFVFSAFWVLGPVISKRDLGGAGAWATMSSCFAVGTVIGGVAAMRLRWRRPLLASVVAAGGNVGQLAVLPLRPPIAVLGAVALVAGAGIAVHLALWFTVFQERVPEHAVSRVSSYDALGSFVLIPLGSAVAGPIAGAVGIDATLLGAAAIALGCELALVAIPDVRRLEPAVGGA